MKKRTFIIVTLLGVAVILLAGCSQGKDNGLLYKISGNGLDKPSYIFGTHHFADTELLESIKGFDEALHAADAVVGELLMTDMAGMQEELMQHMAMPEGYSYSTLLNDEDRELLDKALTEYFGIGLVAFGGIHPAGLSTMLSGAMYAQIMEKNDMQGHVSIDQYVQEDAIGHSKNVYGLETVMDQVNALFYSEPIEAKAKSLVSMIKHEGFMESSLLKLNEYYREGKLGKLYDLSFNNPDDPDPISEEYAYALNKERNDRWVGKLPAMMAAESCFIAVGALHLPGEEGVLNQLRALGYTVEAVN